jgi:thiamine-phosphate pyrophosphorylase|tara:strand:+ start:2386 stop:2916 length:531 start_codon:yes stop_codon:yes gene_type:complete
MHGYFSLKYYFIKDFDTKNIKKQDKQTVIIFRNYSFKKIDEFQILKIRNYCRKSRRIFILSNNIKLALKLDLDGVYIPSFNKSTGHLSYSLKKNFQILGSAHNLKEIKIKEKQKVNKIFISSLFKKNKNFLGINKFKLLSKLTEKEVIALGGVSKKNIRLLKLINSFSFAGISNFE